MTILRSKGCHSLNYFTADRGQHTRMSETK
jgi:hypothetical protein